MSSRKRRVGSIKSELVLKSKEAALTAVQIFNNPNITFKAESYVVLMIISWTYLLHAYYRGQEVEYRYFKKMGSKRRFDRTKHGAFKHWELERCINSKDSPIDKETALNLRFMIGLRHEIEHQMTSRIDDLLSARFQACCLNYNRYLKKLFGEQYGIEKHLSFSLQFSTISEPQRELLSDYDELPDNIQSYIQDFDEILTSEEYMSTNYAYRILFVPKTANNKGQADRVIEFVKSESPVAEKLNRDYAVIKETERRKYLPSQIVEIVQSKGYPKFKMHHHTELWQKLNAREEKKAFGIWVAGKHWHWYESWLDTVLRYCAKHSKDFT